MRFFLTMSVLTLEMCEKVLEQLSNLRLLDRYSESGAPCVKVPRIFHEALLTELFDTTDIERRPHLKQLVTAVCDGMRDGLQPRSDPIVSPTIVSHPPSVLSCFQLELHLRL
jgi:hypothetical protein